MTVKTEAVLRCVKEAEAITSSSPSSLLSVDFQDLLVSINFIRLCVEQTSSLLTAPPNVCLSSLIPWKIAL